MYRITLLIILFFTALKASALSLNSEVDRDSIAFNETLRLIITADVNAQGEIDFSQLTHQFDIINTQRSSQTSIINGKVSATTKWILIIAPKEKGKLIIPSFEYKGVFSPAIKISVSDTPSTKSSGKNTDVFLDVSVDKKSIYVQEQVLLSFRLYYKIPLSDYDTEELKLDNTTIELVSENTFQKVIRSEKYNVLEKIYALHPQASGEMKIPAQSWRLEKSLRSFNFGRSGNPYLYTRSEPIVIKVEPIPDTSTAEHWLPSSAITLESEWQQSRLQAKVGEPLNYQLTLAADGLTAAQLPDITLTEIDGFTIYSDQPETSNSKAASGITGSRTSNFAIIPRSAGRFIFPEVRFTWWNVSSNKEEVITLKAQEILVANGSSNQQLSELPSLSVDTEDQQPTPSVLLWQILTVIFSLLCLFLLFLLWKNKQALSKSETTKTINIDINNASLNNIKSAAENKDWTKFREALIFWGRKHLEKTEINTLKSLGEAIPEIQLPLQQLDNYLYGQQQDDAFNPDVIINYLKSFKKPLKVDHNHEKLQKLY